MRRILPNISTQTVESPLTYPVLAHGGELHGQPAKPASVPEPTENDDDSTLAPETPATQPQDTSAVVEDAAVVSAPTVVAGVPSGLGEAVFTMLVAFPWLLMALRQQFNTKPRL